MGIVLVRVDDRLVHGQIVAAWAPFCKATCIVVASDEVLNNKIRKIAIESCAPKSLKILLKGLSELDDTVCCDMIDDRVIVIFSTLKDIMRAYNNGFRFSDLNIGNVHDDGVVKKLTPSVFINEADEEILRSLVKMGIKFDIRAVPSDKPVDLVRLLN